MREEIIKTILEMVRQINPEIKSISCEDKLYGGDSKLGLCSIEATTLLVNLEERFGIEIDDDTNDINTIIENIMER